ncbi:MAG: hydantoinase/carbamoylase family amidase, partial [Hyphomicrobiales bacterium]|nr:hydantoinase/carbamoylase family amidase [Hyphomicrobiales bacterium]
MSGPTMGAAIAARLEALAALTDEPGKITRLYLSPAHRKAADLVLRWMGEAGMESGIGPLGDAIGRYEASSPGAKTLILGSHVDSVRDAGRYDGCLGVATAVEIVARLHRDGRRLPFAIEVVAFGDEEGVRFPATLGGSRALAGRFDPACLDERDAGGVTRRAALGAFGVDPDPSKIAALALDPAATLGYVEVHIEQGPVLETEGLALAAVTGIAGATRARIELDGVAGHAGTVPMKLRRDALAGVAAAVLAVEARARADDAVVATVGTLEIEGGAPNTVPGRVAFSLDLRSPDDAL